GTAHTVLDLARSRRGPILLAGWPLAGLRKLGGWNVSGVRPSISRGRQWRRPGPDFVDAGALSSLVAHQEGDLLRNLRWAHYGGAVRDQRARVCSQQTRDLVANPDRPDRRGHALGHRTRRQALRRLPRL